MLRVTLTGILTTFAQANHLSSKLLPRNLTNQRAFQHFGRSHILFWPWTNPNFTHRFRTRPPHYGSSQHV